MSNPLPFGLKESHIAAVAPKAMLLDGRIEVLKALGVNWMGATYRALDVVAPQTVIITVIRPERQWEDFYLSPFFFKTVLASTERFTHISCERHQRLLTVGRCGNDVYMVHQPPREWGRIYGRERPVSLRRFLLLAHGICETLRPLHQGKICHGGITPDEFAIDKEGKVHLRRLGYLSVRREVQHKGVLNYDHPILDACISPEDSMREPLEPASDIFSLAVLFYWLLTDTNPFLAKGGSANSQSVLSLKPEPPSVHQKQLPEAIDSLLLKMLAKDPDRRPSLPEVVKHLTEVARGQRASSKDVKRAALEESRISRAVSSEHVPTAPEAPGGQKLTAASPDEHSTPTLTTQIQEASCLYREEQTIDALRIFATLLEHYPQEQDLWLGSALCLLDLERYEELEEHLRQAIFQYPRNTDLQAVRIMAMCETGAREEAVIRAAQIVDKREPSEWPWVAQAIALAEASPNEAVQSYNVAMEKRPRDWRISYLVGRALFLHERHQQATPMLQRAYPLARDFLPVPFFLGQISLAAGDMDRARRFFQRCLEIDPECSEAQEAISQTHEQGSATKDNVISKLFGRKK